MYKKILLATDGSEFSEGAVREAINMARSCKSQLYAISVVEMNPRYIESAVEFVEKMERETRKSLESLRERSSKENVECKTIIREGEQPYEFIVEEADKNQVDVIIMGRRGRTGLRRLLMGSVTAKVIGHTTRRVLVVPKATTIKWKNIIIATDGTKYSEAAAREALNVAKYCGIGSDLHAIAVTRKSASDERIEISINALNEIKSKAKKENIKVDDLLVKSKPHESIYESILQLAKEKYADIIVMGSHGRTGIERLLMGSVTEKVIGYADCAVLVVKA